MHFQICPISECRACVEAAAYFVEKIICILTTCLVRRSLGVRSSFSSREACKGQPVEEEAWIPVMMQVCMMTLVLGCGLKRVSYQFGRHLLKNATNAKQRCFFVRVNPQPVNSR